MAHTISTQEGKPSIALIDGDSIAYIVSNRAVVGADGDVGFTEEAGFEGDSSDTTIVECVYKGRMVQVDTSILREEIQSLLNSIMKYTQTTKTEIWLSASSKTADIFKEAYGRAHINNFRFKVANALSVGYKHNRRTELLPGALECLRMLVTEFGANIADGWEADDEVVFLKNESPDKYALAAVDKDVLGQCPGMHYDYKAAKLVHTSEVEANFMKYWQAIVGDPTDGYKGVPRVGPVGAAKFINEDMTDEELWAGVVSAYKSKGINPDNALTTIRLSSMQQLKRIGGIIVLELFEPPVLK
jgi:hypothetical protein